jgi:hypothetical protein
MDQLAWRDPVALQTPDWQATIHRHPDDATDVLKREGGYGPTHLVELRLSDTVIVSLDDVEQIQRQIYNFLAFINGRTVGIALPVGLDSTGHEVWHHDAVTQVTPWKSSIGWYDRTLANEVPPLFEAWWERSRDEFWCRVLERAVRIYAHANVPDPLDDSVMAAWTALELLAWAVLKIDQEWLSADDWDKLTAAGTVRLLLAWAGVPAEIPDVLTPLISLARARNLVDGPAVVGWVRNRLTHPPKKPADGWPDHDELVSAWRLLLQYVELIVLRLLSYEGAYGTRMHLDGRFTGTVEQVPWSPKPAADS